MPKLIIDDREIEVPQGTKVIEAAERLGIMIPRFCFHEALGSVGACRMCAVKFVQGPFKGVQMSCMIDAQDGMVVSTTDPEAVDFRRRVIEWLMLNHPHDCPVCDEGGQCLLQDETVSSGHGIRRYFGKKRTYRDQYLGVLIAHEMNRCIHCYRCSRFYREYAGYHDLGVMQIANRVYFGRYTDGPLESPFAGNLVDICPTGVYTDKPARFKVRRWDLERSPSVCIHCSLGCNTIANARYREVMRIEGRLNQTVNGYFLCDRGRFGFGHANLPDRPRAARIDGAVHVLPAAVRATEERLKRFVQRAGPSAVACVGSDRCSLETQLALKRVAREQGWRGPHFFADSRVGHTARQVVARLDQRLALSMREIESADFILAVGVDPINEAPVLALAMRQAYRREATVVVIDPRPVFLPLGFEHFPAAPGQMEACLNTLIKGSIGIEELEKLDVRARTFVDGLSTDFPFDDATRSRLLALVERLSASRKPVIVCGTSVLDASGIDLAADHAQLLNVVHGQGGLFAVLPGANSFGAALMSDGTYSELLEAIERGEVKALVVAEADPLRHFPDRERLERAFERLELLVALDSVPSLTAQRAHILLPTTTHFEAGAFFINQEGRIQFADPVHQGGTPLRQVSGGGHPPRVYRPDSPGSDPQPAWLLLQQISGGGADQAPGEVWAALSEEISGLSRLEPAGDPYGAVRVVPERSEREPFGTAPKEAPPRGDGVMLLLVDWTFGTEELSAYYSDVVQQLECEPYACLHPQEATRLGVVTGERIAIGGAGHTITVAVQVFENMAPGVVVLPKHRQLDWQRLEAYSTWLPLDQLRRV